MSFLKKFDLFKQPLPLFLNKVPGYPTELGGLMSIFVLVIVISQLYSISRPLFDYSVPVSYSSYTYVTPTLDPLNISEFRFIVIYGYNNEDKEMTGYVRVTSKDQPGNETSLIRCPQEYIQSYFPQISDTIAKSEIFVYCLPHLLNAALYGNSFYEDYVQVLLSLSTEDTDSRVWFLYQNNFIDPQDYRNPVKSTLETVELGFFEMNYDIEFDHSILSTKEGLLGNHHSQIDTFTLSSSAVKLRKINSCADAESCSLNLWLKTSKTVVNYSRTYASLSSVLGQIGGYAKSIFAIFGVICFAYSSFKYRVHFASEVYNLKYEDNDKKNTENSSQIELSLQNTLIENHTRESKQKIKKLDAKNVGFWSYVMYNLKFCCKRNKEVAILEKATTTTLNTIDVVKLFKKIEEFERLKKLILTPEQRMLFDLAAQPEKSSNLETENLVSEDDYYKAYLKAMKNDGSDNIEKQLIDMMNEEKLEELEERSRKENKENNKKDN